MSRFWKYALVAVLAFTIGSAAVASAASIKQFVLSSEDGTRVAVISPEGRLHTDVVGSVEVSNLPQVQQVEVMNEVVSIAGEVSVGNLPLAQDGSVRVAPPSPEGATLLQTLDIELTEMTDENTPWVNTEGFTRFLLYTRADKQTPGGTSTTLIVLFLESLDGVLNYGGVSGHIRAEHTIKIDENGSLCTGGSCPRREFREVKVIEGDFFYLSMRYIAGDRAVPAHIRAWLYGLP